MHASVLHAKLGPKTRYTEHDLAHQAESASHILGHLVTRRRNLEERTVGYVKRVSGTKGHGN